MPKKRGHGDGGLWWSDTRGRWVATVELPRGADGRRRRVTVTGKTRAAALARRRKVLDDAEQGVTRAKSATVAKLLDEWLERGSPNLSDAARENTAWAVDKAKAGVGPRRLTDLTPEDLEDWLASLAQPSGSRSGYSASTLRRLHGTITRALDWGQARGWLARNPARLVRTPTGPTKKRRSLTVDEARRLLDAAAHDPMGPLIATGLMLGLRPGELLALRWEDVDLATSTLHVVRYLKTRTSRRTLKMPQRLVTILTEHAANQAADQASRGVAPSGLVFCTRNGTAYLPTNIRRSLLRIAERAGLEPLDVYTLRHSTISLLSAANVPLEQIADAAGHASPRTTADVYRHPVVPVIETTEQMGDVLS